MKLQLELNSHIKSQPSGNQSVSIKRNNTQFSNLASGISFGGAETKVAKTFAEKVADNKSFIKFCKLADDNPALAEAIGALFITCGIRPASIMAMPKKDADKNRKAASHSIASGLMGVVFAQILYTPFSKAVAKIKDAIDAGTPEKYLHGDMKYLLEKPIKKTVNGIDKTISNYDCFKQLATYGPKLFTASILAAMTVGIMPYIDKYIIDRYIFRTPSAPSLKSGLNAYDHFRFVAFRRTPKEKELFQNFKGDGQVASTESTVSTSSKKSAAANVSFTGAANAATNVAKSTGLVDKYAELLAKGLGWLATTKPVKKVVEFCVKNELDYTSHLAALTANCLNLFYMRNVMKSKKIEEEQKKPLMLNMFIGTALATVGGYALNDWINKKIKPIELAMKHSEQGKNLMKGFQIARSLMVFQFLYRFITPVIATPIANHISNVLRNKKEGEKGMLLK